MSMRAFRSVLALVMHLSFALVGAFIASTRYDGGPKHLLKSNGALLNGNLNRAGRTANGALFLFSNSNAVPTSVNARNKEMAEAVKSAIASPRTPSCKLIECEFPALAALNKLGDGSLRSAMEADDANLEASLVIAKSFLPAPFGPGKVWMVPSRSSTERMKSSMKKKWNSVHSLADGLPPVKSRDVCVFVSPTSSGDYDAAARLTANGNAVVVVNGQAKTPKSIPEGATMAYYLRPLTNNSQIAGFLVRRFPNKWTVVDASSKRGKLLGTFSDEEILVPKTNTPDLRQSVRLVQQNS